MSDFVTNYENAEKKLREAFKLKDGYPLRLCLSEKWRIESGEGLDFLKLGEGSNEQSYVVIKKRGMKQSFRYGTYSMYQIIDCVKLCIILHNNNKIK